MVNSPQQDAMEPTLRSVVTCPHCRSRHTETMPEYSCAISYQCAGCGAVLRPLPGDCCVYCSFGSVPCPAIQVERRRSHLNWIY